MLQNRYKVLIWINLGLVILIAFVLVLYLSRNSTTDTEVEYSESTAGKLQVIDIAEKIIDIGYAPQDKTYNVLLTKNTSKYSYYGNSTSIQIYDHQNVSLEGKIELVDLDQNKVDANRFLVMEGADEIYLTTRTGLLLKLSRSSYQARAVLKLGGYPTEIVAASSGKYLYVLNKGHSAVDIVDIGDFSKVKSISVGNEPESIAVDSDDEFVYVSSPSTGKIIVISSINLSKLGDIIVGGLPGRIIPFRGGDYIMFLDQSSNKLRILDQQTNQVVSDISTVENPVDVGVSLDGRKAYVLGYEDVVGIVDLVSEEQTKVIRLGSSFEVQEGFNKLILDQGKLIITNQQSGKLYLVDPT